MSRVVPIWEPAERGSHCKDFRLGGTLVPVPAWSLTSWLAHAGYKFPLGPTLPVQREQDPTGLL